MMSRLKNTMRRSALALSLTVLGCQRAEINQPVYSYASTDNSLLLVTDGRSYYFGPQVLADETEIMSKLSRRFNLKSGECYFVDYFVLAQFNEKKISCGAYALERKTDKFSPFVTYEATCKTDVLHCPGQSWKRPTIRYYLNKRGELLMFELYPDGPDHVTFVRTSPSALKLQ